jgi:hypothetical protein
MEVTSGHFTLCVVSPDRRYLSYGVDGCMAMIDMPTSATAAPAMSQRVGATPSTI